MNNLIPTANLQSKAEQVFIALDVSEMTRADYCKAIKSFVAFISQNPLTHNSFLEFKKWLGERKDIGVSSKNKYLIAARVLLKELSRTGFMQDITQNVKGFSQGKKHKKDGLNDAEIASLLTAVNSMPDNFEGLRFRAIVSLLIFQGLRQKEIVGLDISHIYIQRGMAQVTGKGRDDFETIHLHPEALKAVVKYIALCGNKSGALFFGRGSERLCCRSLRRLVTNQLLALGINKSTHGFRHFFCTTLVKSFKGDLLRVMEFTRHKSTDMVIVYNDAVLASQSLPQYYEAFNGATIH